MYSLNRKYTDYNWENDLTDFRPPYYLCGPLDREMLRTKYLGLQKTSQSLSSRTGKEVKQLFDYG